MTTLYYSKITPAAFVATTEAAGYPAANVGREAILRPWRSTSTAAHDLTLTWAAALNVAAVLVSDVNFPSASVTRSVDGATFTNAATLTANADKVTSDCATGSAGRRRGLLAINVAALKGIRLSIGAGVATDGLGYYRVGSVYLLGAGSTLARNFDMGATFKATFPKVSKDLPNGLEAEASTGAERIILTLPFDRRYDQDVLELMRRGRLGTIGLDLEDPDYPEMTLPMRFRSSDISEQMDQIHRTKVSIELREQV